MLDQQEQTLQQDNLEQSVLPPFGNSFMYIETSSNNHRANVRCSFERTDIIQISNLTF